MPPHLRGSGYAGATRLGHGDGYVYAHSEPDGVAQQDYLPEDLQGQTDYYRPTDRGFEERLGPRWDVAQVPHPALLTPAPGACRRAAGALRLEMRPA